MEGRGSQRPALEADLAKVLRGQIFILQKKLLVHRARYVRQQSHPLLVFHDDRHLTLAAGVFGF